MAAERIKEVKQWLIWAFDNGRKRPYDLYGNPSGSTHAEDYVTYAEAMEASERLPHMQGPAFCFTPGDPFVGIDIDDCLADGVVKEWAVPIIEQLEHTYYETSPSLTGIKAYGIGTLPPGIKHSVPVGDGHVELYDAGRFFTFTGLQSSGRDVEDVNEALYYLFDQFEWRAAVPAVTSTVVMPFTASGLQERALKYVEAAEIHKVGDRNRAVFNLSGHLRSMDHYGEVLTEDAILELSRLYNARLPTPMDDKEVAEAVQNSAKHGTPREPKPAGILHVREVAGVDTSAIVAPKASICRSPQIDIPFPQSALEAPGLIADIMAHNLATALYPQPQFALAGAMALVAALIGRKTECTAYRTRSNMYLICIAGTGVGKQHARNVNKEILALAGCEDLLGVESVASSAALVSEMVAHPSSLMQFDEFSHLAEAMNNPRSGNHLRKIVSCLLKLHDESRNLWIAEGYADRKINAQVNQPNAVLFATSTPESFWESMTGRNVTEGLFARLAIFEGFPVKKVRREADEEGNLPPIPDPPESLLEQVRAWYEYQPGKNLASENPQPWRIPYERGASKRLDAHMNEIADRGMDESEQKRAIWARVGQRSAKFALVFACSRCGSKRASIGLEDVNRGIALSNWMARKMLRGIEEHLAENTVERDLKRVLKVIRERGPVTNTQLTAATRWLKARDREDIIRSLSEENSIEISFQEVLTGNGAARDVRVLRAV